MLKISYIKLLKTLYLKAPIESHSCILLFNVLYNIAPLYRSDLLLTHRSLLGTYSLLDWLDLVFLVETLATFWNILAM